MPFIIDWFYGFYDFISSPWSGSFDRCNIHEKKMEYTVSIPKASLSRTRRLESFSEKTWKKVLPGAGEATSDSEAKRSVAVGGGATPPMCLVRTFYSLFGCRNVGAVESG